MGKQEVAERTAHHIPEAGTAMSWEAAGYPGSIDYDSASIISRALFTYAGPFLKRGKQNGLEVQDAGPLLSTADKLGHLEATYSKHFTKLSHDKSFTRSGRNVFLHALLRAHAWLMLQLSTWAVLESLFRLLSPLCLRQFLHWLRDYENAEKQPQERVGWMWACLLILAQVGLALTHHQLFWYGMRFGFLLKQQVCFLSLSIIVLFSCYRFTVLMGGVLSCQSSTHTQYDHMQAIAAVHDKLLRLNSATFNHVSTGQIVNLVSNDVRRFDDFGTFWMFAWAGPLETLAVLIMVGLEMGWWPAVAGVSTLLLVIPCQAQLAGKIGNLRSQAAGHTDERVRITGENSC
jgi:ABC-type multidrug transport system fused ATPase/permease subunit